MATLYLNSRINISLKSFSKNIMIGIHFNKEDNLSNVFLHQSGDRKISEKMELQLVSLSQFLTHTFTLK